MAKTLRLNVKLIRTGLLVLIACTITISINTVGSGLVTAMLITPAATALMFTKKLYTTMLAAAGIGALSGFLGLYLSYFLNISSGAAIVLVATLFFIIVYFYRKLFPYRNKKIEAGPRTVDWLLHDSGSIQPMDLVTAFFQRVHSLAFFSGSICGFHSRSAAHLLFSSSNECQ